MGMQAFQPIYAALQNNLSSKKSKNPKAVGYFLIFF